MAEVNFTVSFKDIPGFPGYRVGDDGSVWRLWVNCRSGRKLTDKWRPMKLSTGWQGYLRINLVPAEGGTYQTFRVHRIVLLAFVGPCPDGQQCRHINGVRTDNRLINLAWGTIEENTQDRILHANYGPQVKTVFHNGKTLPLKHWAKELGIPYHCLWQRIHRLGMSFQEAIERPFFGTESNGGHWGILKKQKVSWNEQR